MHVHIRCASSSSKMRLNTFSTCIPGNTHVRGKRAYTGNTHSNNNIT